MNDYAAVVSKKYAHAFLNSVGPSFSLDDFKKICVLGTFLKQHRARLFFLRSTMTKEPEKQAFFVQLLAPFGAHTMLAQLVAVLARHRRLFLLPQVLAFICQLYGQEHGIEPFVIASSHALSSEQCAAIARFIECSTHRTVVYEYACDPGLIAGIRVQSQTLQWEYSVNKQLTEITRSNR